MRTMTRRWGRSGIETSALGVGCWAVGGEWQDAGGNALGWGRTDDEESVAALRRAMELGVTFFDTADVYGAGRRPRPGEHRPQPAGDGAARRCVPDGAGGAG